MRIIPGLCGCLLVSGLLGAGESVAVPPVAGGGKTPPASTKRPTALELVAEQEKWVFEPTGVRRDVFLDLAAILNITGGGGKGEQHPKGDLPENPTPGTSQNTGSQGPSELEKMIALAQGEELRVRTQLAGKEYDKAMKTADAALRQLDPHASKPELMAIIESIRQFRNQAEAAKRRDEAQATFDALRIKVLGVLWSQTGVRMAIVEGETQAKMVNDRIKDKDCTILYIDQDRVVFRVIYAGFPYEFPVYVEQQTARKP